MRKRTKTRVSVVANIQNCALRVGHSHTILYTFLMADTTLFIIIMNMMMMNLG